MSRGKFITFEGVDGAGKSTQIDRAAEALQSRRIVLTRSREPGGTPLGERLRELVLHEPMHLETEALLMFAARREHLAQVIEPALARGDWVLCDRFTDATFAYQGGGRGMALDKIAQLEQWTHAHLQPDLTVIFDLPLEIAAQRLAGNGQTPDKFEREQGGFFERVRAAYLDRARHDPGRCKVVDASGTPDAVWAQVHALLASI